VGIYTDNLRRRRKIRNKSSSITERRYSYLETGRRTDATRPNSTTHLISCAIMRDGFLHRGYQSHANLRGSLGDPDPYTEKPTDISGFFTSDGRFVTRSEAQPIALAASQIRQLQNRPLLSSDIDWNVP